MRISDWSSDVCSSDLFDRERFVIDDQGAKRLYHGSASLPCQRQPQRNDEAAIVRRTPFAARGGAIARQQALADVAEAEPGARRVAGRLSVDVVFDAQDEQDKFGAGGQASSALARACGGWGNGVSGR